MKKVLLAVAIAATLGLTAFTTSHKAESYSDCKYGRCAAIKADGNRCRNCCQEGSNYCWSHR